MRNSKTLIILMLLFGFAAAVAIAGEAGPAPNSPSQASPAAAPAVVEPPASPSTVPDVEEESPAEHDDAAPVLLEPSAPSGETPSVAPSEPAEPAPPAPGVSTAPAVEAPKSPKEEQADIYRNYERIVRVMDIVESRYVQPVDSHQLFEGAIRGILGSLDPYSAYIPPDVYKEFMEETEQQFSGVGITMSLEKDHVKVISTLEDMPAFRAGVQPGDYILKVEDRPIEELGSLDDISRRLRGAAATAVKVTFFRPSTGKEFTLSLVREDIPIQTLRGYRADAKTGKWDFLIDPKAKIGYIRVTKFAQNTAGELDDAYHSLAAQGARGLVLDLRYNPGGLLDSGVAIAGRFIDEGLIVRTQGRAGIQSESYANGHDTYRPMLPLVVLVNEYSASAAEVLGGALQDHSRAVLVGTRTFGKGSVQNVIDLDGEGAIKLTIAYYYTPSGRLVHRLPNAKDWGLLPNVDSPMTPDQQIKLREEWSRIAGGAPPVILGELGGPVIDIQLSRAVDILRGMLLARHGIDKAAR